MGEDMTYATEPTRAQLAARVTELERENAELRARLDAVPVGALRRTLLTGYRDDTQITADADAINTWLKETALFVDWSTAPEWALWWAVDDNRFAYWYSNEPMCDVDCWQAQPGTLTTCQDVISPEDMTSVDWRETLQYRPHAPQPDDDTDAPLKLATVEGDE